MEGITIKEINIFKYLGSIITNKRTLECRNVKLYKTTERNTMGRRLQKDNKIKIYRSIIGSIILYGAETWTINQKK